MSATPSTTRSDASTFARWGRRFSWLVAGIALLLVTLWCGVYFWLGSSPGRAQLLSFVELPDGVSVGAVRWGPAPDALTVGYVRVQHPDGRVLALVTTASADVRLGALVLDGELEVEALEIDLSHVEATTGRDGELELLAVLAPPPPTTTSAAPATKKKAPKAPSIDALAIHVGSVWVDLGFGLKAAVRDLTLTGSLLGQGPPALALDLVSGACEAVWDKAKKQVGFDECRVSVNVQGQDIVVTSLELGRDDKEVLSVEGTISGGDAWRSQWRGWGRLGPREADAALSGSFPAGFDFDGLALTIDAEHVAGSLGIIFAPRWSAGPFSADHVALAIAGVNAEPGLLVPELDVTLDGLAAARFEGLGWSFEGLYAPQLHGDLERRLIASADGWSSRWTLPTGAVGPTDIRLMTRLKLTGGRIDALVETPHGTVEALGTLKSSPLTKRTSFVAELRFQDVSGPLADALMPELTPEQRAGLGERPHGSAEIEVEVDRADRNAPWETTVEWVLGRLEPARGHTGTALEWDGYAWETAPPTSSLVQRASEPDEEEPP